MDISSGKIWSLYLKLEKVQNIKIYYFNGADVHSPSPVNFTIEGILIQVMMYKNQL
jgi:hypothetical protein